MPPSSGDKNARTESGKPLPLDKRRTAYREHNTDLVPAHNNMQLADKYSKGTDIARAITMSAVVLGFLFKGTLQVGIDSLWAYLREDSLFQSAHYETIYVTVIYTFLIIVYPFAMHHIPYFRRFKVSKEVKYVNQTFSGMGIDLLFHLSPLLIADMLIIKRYPGVPYSEIAIRKRDWIVSTRPLPQDSPEFITMCLQVAGSVFLFDVFFTIVHYVMHRNRFLYKYFHSQHHDHEVVHAHVTNQLSVVERGLQVISANYALKAFGCHPLTRLVFVPIFLWLLIENHTGIDLPWAPHRVLPGNIMGGPAKHYAHHTQGYGNYQPFFTYLDNWLNRNTIKDKKTVCQGQQLPSLSRSG